jgi:hypothetical protein
LEENLAPKLEWEVREVVDGTSGRQELLLVDSTSDIRFYEFSVVIHRCADEELRLVAAAWREG